MPGYDDELTDEDLAALEGALDEAPVSVADTPQDAPDAPEPKDNGARPAFAPPAVAPAKQAPAFNEDDAEVQGLKAAIVERGRKQLSAGIGEAADAFSSALLKQKPATDYWQGRMAMAEAPVKEWQSQQALRDAFDRRVAAKVKADRDAQEAASKERLRTAQIDNYGRQAAEDAARAERASTTGELQRRAFDLRKEDQRLRAEDQRLRREDTRQERALRREERTLDRELKTEGKKEAEEAKRKSAVTDVEGFGANITRNLGKLRAMVDKEGTFSATGPEGQIMGALIKEIAVDSAKLADPGSVAREGEVAMEMSKLWDPQSARSSLSLTNDTAKALLDDYLKRVEDRVGEAYRVRGLTREAPQGRAPPAPLTPSGKPFARMQRNQKTGAVRYLDADGKEVR